MNVIIVMFKEKKNMKKYLLATAAVVALSTGVSADAMKGFYVGAHAGASFANTGKLKDATGTLDISGGSIAGTIAGANKNSSGFTGNVFVGHGATFGKAHFSGELTFGYDTSSVQVGATTLNSTSAATTLNTAIGSQAVAGTAYKMSYRPEFAVGLGVRTGMYLTHGIMGFVRLGVDYNFGKTETDFAGTKYNDSVKVWSVTPGLGVMGHFNNDKMSWIAGVDYKIAFNITKDNNNGYCKKPRALMLKAGVAYHF